LYTKAIAIDPDYWEAYLKRGNALLRTIGPKIFSNEISAGDYAAIIGDYSTAIRLSPVDTEAYYQRGFMKYMHKDYNSSIADYKKLLQMGHKNVRSYQELTMVLNVMPDYDRAIKEYTLLIASGKNYYLERGHIKYKQMDYAGTLNDYKEVLKTTRDSARIFINMADVYIKLGDYKTAVDCYTKSINCLGNRILTFSPANAAGFYLGRAKAGLLAGQYKSALNDYDRIVKLRPVIQSYNLRGDARYKAGDKTGACDDWNEAYKLGSRALIAVDSLDKRNKQGFPNLVNSYQLDIFDTVGFKATIFNINKYCK